MPYVSTELSLPRSLDVQISLSRPTSETRTPLDVLCVACEDLGLLPDSRRVRFYSTMEALEQDFASGSEAYFAGSAFFAQTPRANRMAIGEVFSDPQRALLVSAPLSAADIAALALVTTGSMLLAYNPDGGSSASEFEFTGMDFDGVVDIAGVASVISGAIIGGEPLTCTVRTLPGGSQVLVVATVASGDGVTISFPTTGTGGAFVGGLLRFTAATGGTVLNGYTPIGIADELASILNAANAVGEYVYGWCLGASLRDVPTQEAAAAWVLARTGIMALTTNDLTALNPAFEDDLASVIGATGNRRVFAQYHDNPQRYPDVSILAYLLHVNYRLPDAAVTAKFKQLPGIETVQLSETEWLTLKNKGYNTYTAIGNSARVHREGVTLDSSWYIDSVINLDNFVEDLSVNVYNVFLRRGKIPYTRQGQMLLVDAARDTGNLYEFNGTFADREILDPTKKGGVVIVPAVLLEPTNIALMSAADRAARIGPPIRMTVQEAGAIHSVALNVEVVS